MKKLRIVLHVIRNLRRWCALVICTAVISCIGGYAQNNTAKTNGSTSPNSQNNNQDNTTSALHTADDFMRTVAENYAKIKDMSAIVTITQGSIKSIGTIFVKSNNKLRINFSKPPGQVISSDDTDFYIYIPSQNITLHQSSGKGTTTGSFATQEGLDQLRSRYIASYSDKPYYVSVAEFPGKPMMKIRMRWKSTSQSFRSLELFIGKDLLIYRVDGVTYNRQNVSFEFSNIKLNEGIPDARFTYDPPPTANVVDNFLFESNR